LVVVLSSAQGVRSVGFWRGRSVNVRPSSQVSLGLAPAWRSLPSLPRCGKFSNTSPPCVPSPHSDPFADTEATPTADLAAPGTAPSAARDAPQLLGCAAPRSPSIDGNYGDALQARHRALRGEPQ
jgi:hypothetical protein